MKSMWKTISEDPLTIQNIYDPEATATGSAAKLILSEEKPIKWDISFPASAYKASRYLLITREEHGSISTLEFPNLDLIRKHIAETHQRDFSYTVLDVSNSTWHAVKLTEL